MHILVTPLFAYILVTPLFAFRDWRQSGGHQPGMLVAGQSVHDPIPSQGAGPSSTLHPPSVSAANQPSSSLAKRGPMLEQKGKKHKSVSQMCYEPWKLSDLFLNIFCLFVFIGPDGRANFYGCRSKWWLVGFSRFYFNDSYLLLVFH